MFNDKKIDSFKKIAKDVANFSEALRSMSSSSKEAQDAIIKLGNLIKNAHDKNK
jgi:hypothetical protein